MASNQVTLNVRGMTCAACVRRVEQGLESLGGVHTAAVNFATEKATVTYDRAVTDVERIAAKVKDLGYDVVDWEESPGAGLHGISPGSR